MAPKKHAWFSPSSAAANMACPARCALNQKESPTNIYSEQGTQCHEACELIDSGGVVNEESFAEEWQEQAVLKAMEMRERYFSKFPAISVSLEEEVNLSAYGLSDVFGTADVIASAGNLLVIMDYKFGSGIAVSPENNAQLMIYALGALQQHPGSHDIRLTINQPRLCDEVLEWTTTREHLEKWMSESLAPAIVAAKAENPPFNPGEMQCRWCDAAKVGCPAQLDQLIEMLPVPTAPHQHIDFESLCNEDVSILASKIPDIKSALKSLESVLFSRLNDGAAIPGFKLVRKSKHRTWKDPEKVDKFLQRQKLKINERFAMKLISPAKAEKILQKDGGLTPRKLSALQKHIVKPVGDPTWAASSDKREQYIPESAIEALNDEIDLLDIL